MRLLKSYDEFCECLDREPFIVLFEWVDWSKYARDLGYSICKEAEDRWNAKYAAGRVIWCYGDFSNVSSPMMPIYTWALGEQSSQGGRIANIGIGKGTLFWIGNGKLLDVSMSAYQLGVEAVLHKAAQHFTAPG